MAVRWCAVVDQGTSIVRRTFSEWGDFLYYAPAMLDGGLSIVEPELRDDLAALWQLLMVVVFSTKERPWYTTDELDVIWVHCIRQIGVHLDALGRHVHAAVGDQQAADLVRQQLELQDALSRIRAHDALSRDIDREAGISDGAGLRGGGGHQGEEEQKGDGDPWAHLCYGTGIALPFNTDSKTKLHLAFWPG